MKKIIGIFLLIIISLGGYWWWTNRITVSIIIPVYNAEIYLNRCLDSVFAQSGTFEVIAVNDGSTDKSPQILQNYAKKHSNMKIINQENKGVSAARNAGLKKAKNKYITFVDSDDWLEEDSLKRVIKKIKEEKPDIVLTALYDVYDKKWVEDTRGKEAAQEVPEESKFPLRKLDKLSLFSPFYGNDAYSDLFYSGTGIRGVFFKRELIEKNNFEFANNIKCGEDDIFVYRAFLHNPLISIITEPIYNYRNRVDSLAKSQNAIKESRKSLATMQQTKEYEEASRQIQLWIDDTWLSWVILGIANLQRHNIPWQEEANNIYPAIEAFNKYNSQELKSCRNYQKLKLYMEELQVNQPL